MSKCKFNRGGMTVGALLLCKFFLSLLLFLLNPPLHFHSFILLILMLLWCVVMDVKKKQQKNKTEKILKKKNIFSFPFHIFLFYTSFSFSLFSFCGKFMAIRFGNRSSLLSCGTRKVPFNWKQFHYYFTIPIINVFRIRIRLGSHSTLQRCLTRRILPNLHFSGSFGAVP